jgi:hypothetical protein
MLFVETFRLRLEGRREVPPLNQGFVARVARWSSSGRWKLSLAGSSYFACFPPLHYYIIQLYLVSVSFLDLTIFLFLF